eukprot:scaffold7843_cov64-Cylindrotheca_fusiformis.AAC.1
MEFVPQHYFMWQKTCHQSVLISGQLHAPRDQCNLKERPRSGTMSCCLVLEIFFSFIELPRSQSIKALEAALQHMEFCSATIFHAAPNMSSNYFALQRVTRLHQMDFCFIVELVARECDLPYSFSTKLETSVPFTLPY